MGEIVSTQLIAMFENQIIVADFITDVLNPQYSFSLN